MPKKPRAKWGSPEWREQRREAGRKGGRANVEKYGVEKFREMGAKVGAANVEKYGIEHFREMNRKSHEAKRRKKAGEGTTVQGDQ